MSPYDNQAIRQRPITISSDVQRGGATVFVVRVGDSDTSRTARFFEVQLPEGSHTLRAEWDTVPTDDPRREQGFAFRLIVDGGEARDVVFKDGQVFEPGYPEPVFQRTDSFAQDVSVREQLQPFWVFGDAEGERARLIAPQFPSRATTISSSVTDWAGCEADFTGAGAGLGALAGGIAGGIKGAGIGAAVGGVMGATFGLGYCTAEAVCG